MAVERENINQEDINSFAHLLRTFLPDHEDLNLNESAALLGQSEGGTASTGTFHGAVSAQTVYDAGPSINTYKNSSVPEPADGTDDAHIQKDAESGPHVDEESPEAKAKDPDFEPNTDEEEEDVDSDATVEIPLSELREACPDLAPKVAQERAAAAAASKAQAAAHEMDAERRKWFACFICDDQYGDVDSYKMHMNDHCEEAGSIKCQICESAFPSQSLFNSHRKLSTFELLVDRMALKRAVDCGLDMKKNEGKRGRKALREESYICNVCGKITFKYPSFLNHVASHDGAFSFQCAICQEGFPEPCLLRGHIDLQHPHVLPYQCRRCLKRFKLRGSLATHLKTCDVDPSSLPYAQEMQFIDQLSQKRKMEGKDGEEEEAAQYSCPICMVMYDSPEDLQRHMKHHDEMKPYRCDECGRGFTSKAMMHKHMNNHGKEEKSCRCEICGVELLTRSGYNAHLRGHRNQEIIQARIIAEQVAAEVKGEKGKTEPTASVTDGVQSDKALKILQKFKQDNVSKRGRDENEINGAQPVNEGPKTKPKTYPCPLCGMMFFSSGEQFQVHCRKLHKDAGLKKCDVCNKLYYGEDNLEKHRKQHKLYTDTFPCDECDKVFRRKFALQVHKKMHSFKKFVKCDICGQGFRFVSEVDKHKNKKHRYDRVLNIYKCNICGQRFPVLSHLSVHCYCHNQPDATPFECDLCNSAFKTSIELKQHIFKKHEYLMKNLGDSIQENFAVAFDGTQIKSEPMDEEDSEAPQSNHKSGIMDGQKAKGSKPETSGDASGDTSEVAVYNLHTLQFSHKSKVLKRYHCEVCQKAFASNSDLKTHRRTHSGETPFKCDYCERSFKQRGHRKLHIQVVHTKEMPYKCNQCDAAFPTRYRYQIHLKRHTGVRDYKCLYCEKEFYTLGKLNDHKKRRHPADWKKEKKIEEKAKVSGDGKMEISEERKLEVLRMEEKMKVIGDGYNDPPEGLKMEVTEEEGASPCRSDNAANSPVTS